MLRYFSHNTSVEVFQCKVHNQEPGLLAESITNSSGNYFRPAKRKKPQPSIQYAEDYDEAIQPQTVQKCLYFCQTSSNDMTDICLKYFNEIEAW